MSSQLLMLLGRHRAGAWSPAKLSNLVLWADAQSIVVGGAEDGDPISIWTDSSTAGHDLAQPTTVSRPVIRLAQLGSEPVVDFDGVDDFLATAMPVMPATGDSALWCVVYQYAQSGDARAVLSTGYNSGIGLSANGAVGLGGILGSVIWLGDGTNATGRWLFFVARRTTGVNSIAVNGTQIVTDSHVPVASVTGTLLGCGDPSVHAHCRIAQAGFINGALTDTDMAQLSAYIVSRYGWMDGSGL